MTIDDQIRDENLQHFINREAAKISGLSSGKLDKYEYLTGKEILSSNQKQIIEQAKFNYSPLGRAFEKHIKTIEDQGKKQVRALNNLKTVKTINLMITRRLFDKLSREKQLKCTTLVKKLILII